MAENKLWRSHSLEQIKDTDGVTTSGALTFWENKPVSPFNIGDVFQPVPDGPLLKVGKISISDSVIGERFGRPYRQWQIVVESETDTKAASESDTSDADVKYTFLVEKNSDGTVTNTGTMEVINTGDNPAVSINLDGKFNVPGVGEVSCVKVSGCDEYTDSGAHKWNVVYEGTKTTGSENGENNDNDEPDEAKVQYTFVIEQSNEGIVKTSGSMQVENTGDAPLIKINVGENFTVPGIGEVVCTKINGGNDYSDNGDQNWKIIYDGAKAEAAEDSPSDDTSIPDNEETISYEFNGITTRSVTGEFIALRRSQTPITKKSITLYTSTSGVMATLGTVFAGGIAVSEQITKETQKVNGVTIGTYYRHDIEVEA